MGSMLSLLLGDGIFVSNGEVWRKQRRMMDPAFNQARIQDVFPLMRDATEAMGARLAPHADGDVLAIDEETTHVTADIIFRTIFSRELKRDEAEPHLPRLRPVPGARLLAGRLGARRPAELPVRRPPLRGAATRARSAACSSATSQERLDELAAEPDAGAQGHPGLAARGGRSGHAASNSRARNSSTRSRVMFLAGHETSASALAWALYLIAMRPDIQERMHAEAVAAFGDRAAGIRRHQAAQADARRVPRDAAALSARLLHRPRRHAARDDARQGGEAGLGALRLAMAPAAPPQALGPARRLRSGPLLRSGHQGFDPLAPTFPSAPARASASAPPSPCRRAMLILA